MGKLKGVLTVFKLNYLDYVLVAFKFIMIVAVFVLFCVGNTTTNGDHYGLFGMIPLMLLAIYLSFRYISVGRWEVTSGFSNRKKSQTFAFLFILAAFFLMLFAYGVNRYIDEYNQNKYNLNLYILHDAAPITLFYYIVDLVFVKSFYIFTYPGVSRCPCVNAKSHYTWKYILLYTLRLFDIVVIFPLVYLLFFIFKEGVYHTVPGGGVIFIFIPIIALVPFVFDFIFGRGYAESFKRITEEEDRILAEESRKRVAEQTKKLHEILEKERIAHPNNGLVEGTRVQLYSFKEQFLADLESLGSFDHNQNNKFPEFNNLNLGRGISRESRGGHTCYVRHGGSGYEYTYGLSSLQRYWSIVFFLRRPKNGEYQLEMSLKFRNEWEYIKDFTKLGVYHSKAGSIECEVIDKAWKKYKKAPRDLTTAQVYDDGSIFGEWEAPAIDYQDFKDAELALRKKEIDAEKRKEIASAARRHDDAMRNYFAHFCKFVEMEFNKVDIVEIGVNYDTHEIKKLKVEFGLLQKVFVKK